MLNKARAVPDQVELVDVSSAGSDICDQMLQIRNLPEIRDFMISGKKISKSDHGAWLASLKGNRESRVFAAMVKNVLVGQASFTRIDRKSRQAEWGFYIAPEHQGKGHARQLLEKMLCLAFGEIGLHKLTASVLDYNVASLNLHAVLGFVQEGKTPNKRRCNGVWHELVVFGLERQNWLDKKLAGTGTGIA